MRNREGYADKLQKKGIKIHRNQEQRKVRGG